MGLSLVLVACKNHSKSKPLLKNFDFDDAGALLSSLPNFNPVMINDLLFVSTSIGWESMMSNAWLMREIMVGLITFFSSWRFRVRVRMMPSWLLLTPSSSSSLHRVVAKRETPSLLNRVLDGRLEGSSGEDVMVWVRAVMLGSWTYLVVMRTRPRTAWHKHGIHNIYCR